MFFSAAILAEDSVIPLSLALPYAGRVTAPTDRTGRTNGVLGGAFVRHRAVLLRYLRARGAGEDAEDLLQELWLKIDATSEDGNVLEPLPYLYRMAHNLMVDRRRSDERRVARDQHYQGAIDVEGAGVDHAPNAERTLVARDNLRQMDVALAALGARTDYIFRRHRVEGVSQRQIAEELGITLSGVEKHLQKAYRAVLSARMRLEQSEAAPRAEKGRTDG